MYGILDVLHANRNWEFLSQQISMNTNGYASRTSIVWFNKCKSLDGPEISKPYQDTYLSISVVLRHFVYMSAALDTPGMNLS